MTTTCIVSRIKNLKSDDLTVLDGLSDDELKKRDSNGRSSLHAACANGHSQILRALLIRIPELKDAKDDDGVPPVLYAAGHEWK